MKTKKTLFGAVAVALLVVGSTAGGAAADSHEKAVHSDSTAVEAVAFTLDGANCAYLDDDVVIEGTGTKTSKTHTKVLAGITTLVNDTRAVGTATDGTHTFRFLYKNSAKVRNSVGEPDQFTGLMYDSFRLHKGTERYLANGFIARATYDLTGYDGPDLPDELTTAIVANSAYGDPLDFDALMQRCDPL